MGLDYEYEPPHPEEQHQRLVALRLLTSRSIPCILWAEDALNYVHSVPTMLFDQQVLLLDDLLESASSALVEGPYSAAPFTPEYADYPDESGTDSSFPRGILHLLDQAHCNTEEYASHPLYVLLLPQSYFGFDVRSKERFQSLVPPLPLSNAGILAPKYHTFLEGLVAFNMNPPIPLEKPHVKQRAKHCIFITYLLRYRVKYEDGYGAPMITEVLPEEYVILNELETEEARWYVGMFIHEHRFPVYADMMEFFRRTRARASES